jgi:hypothetical protein
MRLRSFHRLVAFLGGGGLANQAACMDDSVLLDGGGRAGYTDAGKPDASVPDVSSDAGEMLAPLQYCENLAVLLAARRSDCFGGPENYYASLQSEIGTVENCVRQVAGGSYRNFNSRIAQACLAFFASEPCETISS